jgi:glucosamine-6-phosphate deaminase
MEVVILASLAEIASAAARSVVRLIETKPDAVLGLPTGNTPLPLYAELHALHRDRKLSFARATTFNLDEFVGLERDHPGAYYRYMRDALFDRVDLASDRTHVLDGCAADIPAECIRYEAAIGAAGGIDLQILGLGANGHIGFNEPSCSLASRTRLITLTDSSWQAERARFGSQEPPRHAMTMGVATILEAKRCLVLANGEEKAAAVAQMIEGPLTAFCPASALQLHPTTTVLIDEAAASRLALRDYYRSVQREKPAGQREQ